MPEEADKVARKQLERLRGMPVASAEYTVVRGYLEWLVELPWSVHTQDDLDLAKARATMQEGELRVFLPRLNSGQEFVIPIEKVV